jgi:hypothetical protein
MADVHPDKLPLWASRVKIQRARMLVDETQLEFDKYARSAPIEHTIVKDGGPRAELHIRIKESPHIAGAVACDAIHNLRSALDLAAAELARPYTSKKAYFPFARSAAELDGQINEKNFHFAGQDAVDVLKTFAPYKGGNTPLRALHDLDIQDKHQSLVPTLFSFNSPVLRLWDDDGTRNLRFMPSDENDLAPFAFQFPINGPFQGQEVVPTLKALVELVESIIEAFARMLDLRASSAF